MWRFVATELAKPIIRRMGSMIAGGLIGAGIIEDQAVQVEQLLTALLLLTVDLVVSHMDRSNGS
jgi:hypothetical protein